MGYRYDSPPFAFTLAMTVKTIHAMRMIGRKISPIRTKVRMVAMIAAIVTVI